MVEINKSLTNFAGGQLSRKLLGRIDLTSYPLGAKILRNFIPEVQGPATYRGGFKHVVRTHNNESSFLLPFTFNDEQAYVLEFSDQKLRFFSDGGVITEDEKTITNTTQANPGVITSASHGYSSGDQIFISGVEGMTELNGLFYLVVRIDANSFSLTDLDGNAIDTSAYSAYSGSGSAERIYEIDTPYSIDDVSGLKAAQKADLMYIVHPDYEPRKLIRTSETNWSLSTYTRTADPFTQAIEGVTQAAECEVTITDHTLETGDTIEIYDVSGMTELNGNTYLVEDTGANTFKLKDPTTEAYINSSGYSAYSSDGYVFISGGMPGAVGFYGGRLFFGGTLPNPETFWGSRAPADDGATRYDNFTTGSDADHAVIFPIASHNNTADRIRWFSGNNKFLAIGTYGAVYKAYGETESQPIAGNAINVSPVDYYGCANVSPVRIGTTIFYVQRGKLILNRFAYSFLADGYESDNLNLLADELTVGGLEQIAVQEGTDSIAWAIRNDGVLLGLTTQIQEKIAAWHEHYLGGTDTKVLSISGEAQPNNLDTLWAVVERTINGTTRRYIEYLAGDEILPEFEDSFSGDYDTDIVVYQKLLWEKAKTLVRLDSSLSLDTSQNVSVTPGAVSGDSVTFTAGSSVFKDGDVGRRIVKKYVNGTESGMAEIVAFNSNTQVVCKVLEDFDSTDEIASGNWYLTVTDLSGLNHLEGETVGITIDGAIHPDKTVSNGAVALDDHATIVHVGLKYTGRYTSMPLEMGGLRGPAQTRTITINKIGILFRHTLGVKYGTDPYNLTDVVVRTTSDYTDRPPPLFTGPKILNIRDSYSNQKYVHILQESPLPCTIQAISPYVDVTNE